MAFPYGHSNSQLQSLHDFYEPLVILRILGPWIGPQIRIPSSTAPYAPLHIFLDRLSWICDYEPGGDTVSAIALERNVVGVTAWLATSRKAVQKVETHLKYILECLQSTRTLSAGRLHDLAQEMCTVCIDFAHERVRRYTKLCCDYVKQCHATLQVSDPLLDRDLTNLMNLAGQPVKLCAAADRFRDSESLKCLSRRISLTESPSIWSLLRHYIGRLGSWHRSSRTLVDYSHEDPEIFQDIHLKSLVTPKPIRAPAIQRSTNLSNALSKMYTPEEQFHLRQGVQSLQRLRGFDMGLEFQEEYRDKNFKPRVHAEVWLLEHFHTNQLTFVENDKYIGCSKPSCYCCNLYFQNHQGGFAQRPSHGNVWTNWQLPTHEDAERQTLDASISSAMVSRFREDLKTRLGSATPKQARVLDSTTGLTHRST